LKEKDKISDNYRKQVDELLDNQSGQNLIEPLNQEELDEIWEEISSEMDIDKVWNDISSDLDIVMPVDSGSGIFLKTIAAVLIILIGMAPVKKALLDSHISQPDILGENKQNEQPAELIIQNKSGDSNFGEQVKGNILPEIKRSLNTSEDGVKPTSVNSDGIDLAQVTKITLSNKVVSQVLTASEIADSNMVISPENIPIEKSNIPLAVFPDDLKRGKVFSEINFDHLVTKDNSSTTGNSLPLTDRGRISGGLITSFKNTWLLNHETLDGLKAESLNSSEIVFFPDVGLSLNYSFNKTWLIQADGFFSSNTGQEYLEYLYGHYTRKKITLKYSEIALSVKYKFTGSSRLLPRTSINVLAGGYFSVLNHASQKIGTDLEDIGSQYKKFDFGVRLGGEFELRIFDQLSLAPGLFLSLGIPNIYEGNNRIPGYLIRTHNGSAEFHLAFYYHFN
jgi:hypothetical protein